MSKENNEQDIIKNPARQQNKKQEVYQPEYLRLNKKPVPYDVLNGVRAPDPNIQVKISPTQRPIAPEFSFKNISETLKNNVNDGSVSSIDGEDFDQDGKKISTVNNGFIDNNDEIDLGFFEKQGMSSVNKSVEQITNVPDIKETSKENVPEIGEYILMVLGKMIVIGGLKIIEAKVQSILYGEDEEFNSQLVKLDDIVVLKRIKVQAGVFLAE